MLRSPPTRHHRAVTSGNAVGVPTVLAAVTQHNRRRCKHKDCGGSQICKHIVDDDADESDFSGIPLEAISLVFYGDILSLMYSQ